MGWNPFDDEEINNGFATAISLFDADHGVSSPDAIVNTIARRGRLPQAIVTNNTLHSYGIELKRYTQRAVDHHPYALPTSNISYNTGIYPELEPILITRFGNLPEVVGSLLFEVDVSDIGLGGILLEKLLGYVAIDGTFSNPATFIATQDLTAGALAHPAANYTYVVNSITTVVHDVTADNVENPEGAEAAWMRGTRVVYEVTATHPVDGDSIFSLTSPPIDNPWYDPWITVNDWQDSIRDKSIYEIRFLDGRMWYHIKVDSLATSFMGYNSFPTGSLSDPSYLTIDLLPIIPLIENKNPVDGATVLNRENRLLGKAIGVNTDSVLEGILDNADLNGQRDLIDSAYIWSSIDVLGTSPEEIRYHRAYWEEKFTSIQGWDINNGYYEEYIQEGTGSSRFNTRYRVKDIIRTTHVGDMTSLSIIGFVPEAVSPVPVIPPEVIKVNHVDYKVFFGRISHNGSHTGGLVIGFRTGPNSYVKFTCISFDITYYPWAEDANVWVNGVSYWDQSDTGIMSVLRIPMLPHLVDDWHNLDSRDIIARSFHIMIFGHERTVLSWYEKASFAKFLKLVAIVYTFYTLGMGINEAGSLWALATVITENVVYLYAAKYAYEYISENIGGKLGEILGSLAAISIIFYGSGGWESFYNLDYADLALDAVNALSGVIGVVGDYRTEQLLEEMQAFDDDVSEALDELAAAEATLTTEDASAYLFGLLDLHMTLDESPTQFYERTIHTGNPGVLLLANADSFVDNTLTLPDNGFTL